MNENPIIVQVVTSMNSSTGDEYIYGLDTEGNLWVQGSNYGTARWEMYIPHDRDRIR